MSRPLTVIGSFVSPYVRKVLACMNLKGLAYEVDPITPFYGNDEFRRLSPLCRIPVLIDGDFSVSDSTVICAYLDNAYPGHALFELRPSAKRLGQLVALVLHLHFKVLPCFGGFGQWQLARFLQDQQLILKPGQRVVQLRR